MFLIGFFPSCRCSHKLLREESKSINDSSDLLLVKISIEELPDSWVAIGGLHMVTILKACLRDLRLEQIRKMDR